MRKGTVAIMVASVMLAGCAAKTVQDVGVGMQMGSIGGGTPLAPLALGAGIITEMAGKIAGKGKQNERSPLSPEEISARDKLIIDEKATLMLKAKLHPKATTFDVEIKMSAKSVCEELDGIAVKYGYIKLSRKQMYQVLPSDALPAGDTDEFQLSMPQNPYGGNCLTEMEMVGHRLVSSEPEEANAK